MRAGGSKGKGDGLNEKQSAFCREYLVDFCGTQAAIRAGYAPAAAGAQASVLLKNPNVRFEIARLSNERADKTDLTIERALREAMRLAFFDVRQLADADGRPRGLTELGDDIAAAVSSVSVAKDGEVLKYRLVDKNAALERLFKHLGLFAKDNAQNNPLAAMQDLLRLVQGSRLPINGGDPS